MHFGKGKDNNKRQRGNVCVRATSTGLTMTRWPGSTFTLNDFMSAAGTGIPARREWTMV